MKQISILFMLIGFALTTGIFAYSDSKKGFSNLSIVKDKKKEEKKKEEVKPKKEKEEKAEEKKDEEEEGDGEKGFGGNRYKYKKDKDNK